MKVTSAGIIKGAMARSGLTQTRLAERCGISRKSMSNYVNHPEGMPFCIFTEIVKLTDMPDEDVLLLARQRV